MRLIGNSVAVKLDAPAEMTKGGIIMPSTERCRTGEVVVVGPGETYEGKHRPMTVKVGDRVLLKPYGSNELKIKGDTICVVDENDIVVILDEGDED